ncbi:MAG: cobalt ECF transporter T component CbiQ [Chloroflexota bacterium]|nr:MAG: cobalt ECF transporter T component CbiQ [Chloroflexota bacterium]
MHFHALDRYVDSSSPIHRLDPRVKLGCALALIVSTALLPDRAWGAFLVSLVIGIAIAITARLGPLYAVIRSAVGLPFLAAALTLLFTTPGSAILDLAFGPARVLVTDAGLIRFVSIAARSLLSLQIAIVLTATTHFPDLLHALRHFGVPAIIVSVVSLMYRYLFVLVDEAGRLLRARAARSAVAAGHRTGGTVTWRGQVAGAMVGQLFIRSYERSDRVYQAMLARGMDGTYPILHAHAFAREDAFAIGTIAIATVLPWIVARGATGLV